MRAKTVDRTPSTENRKSPVANRPSLVWFFIIAGVAFVLRLIHLLQLRHSDPLFFSPQMDALYHHEWVLAVAAGRSPWAMSAGQRKKEYRCAS